MVLEEILQSVSYVTDGGGRKTAVQIDFDLWQELLDLLALPAQALLPQGTPPHITLRFAGLIPLDDLERMSEAIETGCEQVDSDEW
ncbi:MAG: hypothetical protein OT477_11795 [Chloroflexi bacterium]|nr:hypothetical protein [Chloroflexota bacterium]